MTQQPMSDVDSIFDRYEAIRHRLPQSATAPATIRIDSLEQIADDADAFVFDAFGVLNVGDTPIPGASARLDALRARGCAIRILSNAASYDHAGAVSKFAKLGMQVAADEIVTSRDATLAALDDRLWGCIAAPSDTLSDLPGRTRRLEDDAADYDAVAGFVFLSTEVWTPGRQALLEHSLSARPRPVMIANADLAAPRESGLTLEPGFYGHRLVDRGVADVRFFGKPFPEVYSIVEASLAGIQPERIVMCGDTLHTDILGAAARGWQTVLVTRDGIFTGLDAGPYCDRASLSPSWRLERI